MDALSFGRIERRFAPLIAAGIAALGSLIAIAWGVRIAETLPGMAVAEYEAPPPEDDVVLLEPLGQATAVLVDTDAVPAPISEVPDTTTGGIVAATTGAEVGTTAPPEAVVEEEPEVVESLPPPLPNGRWVLFDRFGMAVPAVVQPWCRWWQGDCTEFGPVTPSCVWVEYLGQDRVRAAYRLSDGVSDDSCYDPSGYDRPRFMQLPKDIATALRDAPYTIELVYFD